MKWCALLVKKYKAAIYRYSGIHFLSRHWSCWSKIVGDTGVAYRIALKDFLSCLIADGRSNRSKLCLCNWILSLELHWSTTISSSGIASSKLSHSLTNFFLERKLSLFAEGNEPRLQVLKNPRSTLCLWYRSLYRSPWSDLGPPPRVRFCSISMRESKLSLWPLKNFRFEEGLLLPCSCGSWKVPELIRSTSLLGSILTVIGLLVNSFFATPQEEETFHSFVR